MSQRLSTSVTFQSLNARVEAIESRFDSAGNAKFGGYLDAAYVRSTGASAPSGGAGVELQWDGVTGYLLSFDRSAGAFKPVVVAGSSISLSPQSGVVAMGGTTTFGDVNFSTSFTGPDPLLTFDNTDYLGFNRSANAYAFNIGNSAKLTIQSSGIIAPSVTSDTFSSPPSGGAGGLHLSRAFSAGYTGIIEFLKSDGTRNGYVGFNADAGSMQYGSDTGAGHTFSGGPAMFGDANLSLSLNGGSQPLLTFDSGDFYLYDRTANQHKMVIGSATKVVVDTNGLSATGSVAAGSYVQIGDVNFFAQIVSGNPQVTFDSGDKLFYDRTANKYYFVIGGVNVASIDASGNMRIKGALTQGVTP